MSSDPSMVSISPATGEPHPQGVFVLMWSRFKAQAGLKLLLTLTITPIFLGCYLGIQRIVTATRMFDLLWIDRIAGFDVWWVYVYVSQYLIVPLPPLLAHTKSQLRALAAGISVTSFLSFIVFIVYPVACPRSASPPETNFVYDWLLSIDRAGNAFPSLHVGLSSLAAMYAHRVIDGAFSKRARLSLLTIIWVWTAAIAWSTMATKQHYFLDVVGGFVVAFIGHRVAWWNQK